MLPRVINNPFFYCDSNVAEKGLLQTVEDAGCTYAVILQTLMKMRRRFMEGASAAAFLAAAGCSDGAGENINSKKEGEGMEFNELIEVRRSVRRYAY